MTLLFDDSFDTGLTDAVNVPFTNHAPNPTGIGWKQHPSYSARTPTFDSAGRMYYTGVATMMYYAHPVIQLPSDVDLEITFDILSLIATFPSLCGWVSEAADSMIFARADIAANTMRLSKLVAGVGSELLTAPAHTWTVANDQTITLHLRSDGTASADVNGVNLAGFTATGVTPGGRHGVRLSTGGTASTGIHIKRVRAWNLEGGASAADPPYRGPTRRPARSLWPRIATPLPQPLNQRQSVNTVCFTQDNVYTNGNVQYAVWSTDQRKPILGRRTLPSPRWTTTDLSTISGNPLSSPTEQDAHNSYNIGISTDGHIHIAGNHHDEAPMRYIRTQTPGDITSFAGMSPTGTNENAVTYPAFVKCLDGTLLMFWRQGISGDGDWYANRYSSITHTWTQIGKIVDGHVTAESAYPWVFRVSPTDGAIHMFYCWRTTGGAGGADSNNDFCHIKSLDNGTTWKKMDGTTLTLPVTHATSPLVIDTAATGSGMINSGGADVDTQGRPHAVITLYDGSAKTQLNHVWWDGSTWHVDVETAFTYKQDLLNGSSVKQIGRPAVLCDQAGRTFMLYRNNVDEPGKLILKDISPAPITRYNKFSVWNTPLYAAEITVDTVGLRERNELHALVTPACDTDTTLSAFTDRWWTSVEGFVLSMPMSAAVILGA